MNAVPFIIIKSKQFWKEKSFSSKNIRYFGMIKVNILNTEY